MKSTSPLAKKLSAYSLFAGALFTSEKSQAQIVYHDFAPDDTLHFENSLPLDFDNNGIVDFHLSLDTSGSTSANGQPSNRVAGVFKDSWLQPNQVESFSSLNCVADLQLYDSIGPQNAWRSPGSTCPLSGCAPLVNMKYHSVNNYQLFNCWMPDAIDKYLGVRFNSGNDLLYGWVRVSIASLLSYMVVKDYAYNSVPNESISAGEGIPSAGCVDIHEPNNFTSQASLITVNKKILALIDAPGDKDWFRFTPSADKNNIRVVLRKLPANYNIKLYDQNFQLLGSSKHPAQFNDTIICNNLDPSMHYYVVVKGQNADAYNSNDCYTLKVEASNNAYKLIESSFPQEEDNDLGLFPNPASENIFLSGLNENLSDAEVSVYDLSGRKILSQKISSEKNTLDISSLMEGMYLLELRNEKEVLVKKFEVKR